MKSGHQILAQLDTLVVEHYFYFDIRDKVLTAIQDGKRGSIIMVVGSTGAGKTLLSEQSAEILRNYVKENPDCGYSDPLILEAESPEYGEFSWRAFYTQGLRKMGEPGMYRKINIDTVIEDLRLGKTFHTYQALKVHELRSLYLQALEALMPIAVFVDEIASIGKSRSHENKAGHLNVIKSLSNQRTTVYVLLGTIEAKKMLYHGGQLSRRVRAEPFWHYRYALTEVNYFMRVFAQTLEQLGIDVEEELLRERNYFYAHTLGLMGVLMEWLRCALERMFKKGEKVLTKALFDQTRLSNLQLAPIAKEMAEFEREYLDKRDFDFKKYLNKKQTVNMTATESRGRQQTKPGQRKPKRDRVGTDDSENEE